MSSTRELYIGLMSGTSLDGIDAALVDLSSNPQLIASTSYPLPDTLRTELISLCLPGENEIERLGRADRALGLAFGNAVNALLRENNFSASDIRAIGSHGQTIRHRPTSNQSSDLPFTLQIGDPSSIAEITGITTIADFRRRDIAAGGQGAPLVPAFHRAIFGAKEARAIVNIGGIANISGINANDDVIGFDTGPGNTLLDQWNYRHQGSRFDRDGAWGASGKIIESLLNDLLSDIYFALPFPKSTGREYFHLAWLEEKLRQHNYAAVDVQATLAELTARTIANGIQSLPFSTDSIFICGGGAYNEFLMQRLSALLAPRPITSTTALGIAPEWVEAAAFAWLAQQTLQQKPGNLPSATGARGLRILGAIYPA